MLILGVALLIAAPSFGESKNLEEKAIETFVQVQTAGLHKELLEQMKKLAEAGYSKRGETKAAILGGGCGFGGCNYSFLVTTAFSTVRVNPRTAVLAGIVEVWRGPFEEGSLKRVVSQEEVQKLVVGEDQE